MTKAIYDDGKIFCVCGDWIHTNDMEDELVEELRRDYLDMVIEESKEFICPKCSSKHTLRLKGHIDIQVYSTIKTEGYFYEDLNGDVFLGNQFIEYQIGDEIPLEDGVYITEKYEYHVSN